MDAASASSRGIANSSLNSIANSSSEVTANSAPDQLFLLGCDIAHSLSPLLHGAAIDKLGLPWTYGLRDEASSEEARAFIDSRAWLAMNVTTPYKALALECATASQMTDGVSVGVERFGGVDVGRLSAEGLPGANVLINDACGMKAYNTDGEGARLSLEHEGISLDAANAVICGTGPTAQAIARAAKLAGAADVRMLSRTRRAEGIVRYSEAQGLLAAADIVINATPVGMGADDELPFCADWLKPGHVVLDAVYGHGETPFACAAHAAGCRFLDGRGMLVSQAALTLLLVIAHARACKRIPSATQASYNDIRAIMTEALQDCSQAAHALQ